MLLYLEYVLYNLSKIKIIFKIYYLIDIKLFYTRTHFIKYINIIYNKIVYKNFFEAFYK